MPSRGGVANIGLMRPVPFPSTVTHYVSTGRSVGAQGDRSSTPRTAASTANLYAPRRTFAAAPPPTTRGSAAPSAPACHRFRSVTNGAPPPVREGDWLYFSHGAFTDAAGHQQLRPLEPRSTHGTIYIDDEPIYDDRLRRCS